MKKMLIAAVSAIAVIASVIGCQVYDSQTNANLYHAGVKLQDLAVEYNKACQSFKDDTSDVVAYDEIIDSLWGFTEHFERKTAMTAIKAVVASEQTSEIATATSDHESHIALLESEIEELEKVRRKTEEQKAELVNKKVELESWKDKRDDVAAEIKAKYSGYLYDSNWCKEKYRSSYMTVNVLYGYIHDYIGKFYVTDSKKTDSENAIAKEKFIKEYSYKNENVADYMNCEIVANGDGVSWSIKGLWEKTYKLKWDYNSKK